MLTKESEIQRPSPTPVFNLEDVIVRNLRLSMRSNPFNPFLVSLLIISLLVGQIVCAAHSHSGYLHSGYLYSEASHAGSQSTKSNHEVKRPHIHVGNNHTHVHDHSHSNVRRSTENRVKVAMPTHIESENASEVQIDHDMDAIYLLNSGNAIYVLSRNVAGETSKVSIDLDFDNAEPFALRAARSGTRPRPPPIALNACPLYIFNLSIRC